MTENNSLEDLEKEYKKSKNQSLTDLEDTYQEYKVIGSDEDLVAKISDVSTDENIYLEFLLTEGNQIIVEVPKTIEGLIKLYDLSTAVDRHLSSDLGVLVGETVNVQFENEQMEHIYVGDRRRVKLRTLSESKNIQLSKKTVLPEEIIIATKRRVRYDRGDNKIIRSDIISTYPEDGRLFIEFDLFGETATWSTPVPDSQNMSGSTFESVVEEVGYGSVQQIAEGEFYVIGEEEFPVSLVEVPNLIGKFDNWKNTWALFGELSNARGGLEISPTVNARSTEPSDPSSSSAATQTEHHVPRGKSKAFLDTIQSGESIRYVGEGGQIKIERGGDTETISSLSGWERIAITTERVILKSSQLTGDDYYKLTYDELLGADLKIGFITKKISLRTGYGTYHIKISEPDKDGCREMVDFVKNRL